MITVTAIVVALLQLLPSDSTNQSTATSSAPNASGTSDDTPDSTDEVVHTDDPPPPGGKNRHPLFDQINDQGLLPDGKPPQFVVISFDGSGNYEWIDHWNKFAEDTKSQFTYFVSGVYFLDRDNKLIYNPPLHKPGASDIGYANQENMATEDYIRGWVDRLQRAKDLGVELGTHYNGHFCGKKGGNDWTAADWTSELTQFRAFAANAQKNNNYANPIDDVFANQPLVGGRTPCLEGKLHDVLYPVLAQQGFRYDASDSGLIADWPKKVSGIWDFPLKSITIDGTKRQQLSMDYNFYYSLANAKPVDQARADEIQGIVQRSYESYFNNNYNGTRSPVFIGHHMANWNNFAYMKALAAFAPEVCAQPDVICASNRDLADYLDKLPQGQLEAFQKGTTLEKMAATTTTTKVPAKPTGGTGPTVAQQPVATAPKKSTPTSVKKSG